MLILMSYYSLFFFVGGGCLSVELIVHETIGFFSFMTIRSPVHWYKTVKSGGIAAAIGKDDDWSKHYEDTVTAGYDHHHEKHVEEMVRHAPRIIDSLIKLGVPFDRDLHKQIRLGKEAAHRVRRIAHVHGDGTG